MSSLLPSAKLYLRLHRRIRRSAAFLSSLSLLAPRGFAPRVQVMMGIQEIPVEVAVQIFQRLEKVALLKLSQCCRGFHQIVEPILYSSMQVS